MKPEAASRLAKEQPKPVPGGVVAPKGFRCHAVEAGIKDGAKPRLDLALIFSESPADCAAAESKIIQQARKRLSEQNPESLLLCLNGRN